ncbi:MAG: ABC transporter substrate-binding protein [Gaiellaceae bacterium]
MIAALALVGLLSVGTGAGGARTASQNATVTISMLANANTKPGWDVLIPNFERAYPNIHVEITYAPNTMVLYQLEATQLATGNAPDLLSTSPGCGTPIAVCTLGKAGYLARMVKKPWATRRSVPLVTSYGKYGKDLLGFIPQVAPMGIFTNDTLFAKLGLKVPQTVSQLLDVCRKARAAGTSAVILAGGSATAVTFVIESFAIASVYGKDGRWLAKLKAGKVTFAGSAGWRLALQRFIDMNNAGCFQPGAVGVSSGPAAAGLFAQRQGLMFPSSANNEGTIAANNPQFSYSFRRFPAGSSPAQTTTLITLLQALSVNAHSSARNQAAAQTFIDFTARPAQNAHLTQATGGLSQYQLLKRQLPGFMSSLGTVFAKHRYVINPYVSWWNEGTLYAMQQNQIGLITGQRSVEDVLKAMDAAWKEGPS